MTQVSEELSGSRDLTGKEKGKEPTVKTVSPVINLRLSVIITSYTTGTKTELYLDSSETLVEVSLDV